MKYLRWSLFLILPIALILYFTMNVVPKKHIATINDAGVEDAELLGKVILAAAEIAKSKGIAERGYRLVINCNEEGGQSVFHIHCHLIGGKKLSWNPD